MSASISTNGKWTISNLLMSLSLFLLSVWFIWLNNSILEIKDRLQSLESEVSHLDKDHERLRERVSRLEDRGRSSTADVDTLLGVR